MVDYKEIRKAVKELNDSGVINPKINVVGKSKEVIKNLFLTSLENIGEDVAASLDEHIIRIFNALVDEEEAKEAPPKKAKAKKKEEVVEEETTDDEDSDDDDEATEDSDDEVTEVEATEKVAEKPVKAKKEPKPKKEKKVKAEKAIIGKDAIELKFNVKKGTGPYNAAKMIVDNKKITVNELRSAEWNNGASFFKKRDVWAASGLIIDDKENKTIELIEED